MQRCKDLLYAVLAGRYPESFFEGSDGGLGGRTTEVSVQRGDCCRRAENVVLLGCLIGNEGVL